MNPFITPRKLLGTATLPVPCKLAFVCYCPMPTAFEQFNLNINPKERLFIHTHNSHVMFCKRDDMNFIVVAEVYGGPVSVTTVEELKFYGVETIIGIGFVGSFDDKFKTGSMIMAERALIEYGATPHYHDIINENESFTFPSMNFYTTSAKPAIVWTTNALYREYQSDVDEVKKYGCSVVNMDTSHLFAACRLVNIKCAYFAIVSDLMIEQPNESTWDNALTEAVNNGTSPVIESQSKLILEILDEYYVKFADDI
jgi:uridine phosphorylase